MAASGAITVTVTAPPAGGLVTSYTLTVNPGGTRTLTAPATISIPVAGCATATATATATGPGGKSASSATAEAMGCIPPSPVRNLASTDLSHDDPAYRSDGNIYPGVISETTWDPPADSGGGTLDYMITVHYDLGAADETYIQSTTSFRIGRRGANPVNGISVAARNAAGTGKGVTGPIP
ncbi:hypothetical protein [Frankia tisae]|uniref:hypothetical protein n=1 Tax=Frankia tisae TaxID=2950104 RepID=UPI0021C128FD|nr:hypothetical protein [Frankia tisae]